LYKNNINIKDPNFRMIQIDLQPLQHHHLFHVHFKRTSGCPWPKATVKSPVGACNLRPLFFIFSYFLLPWTPCPALPCPCPTLFRIFLLLPGTEGRSYTGNGYLKQECTYTWWEAFEHMQKLLNRK
jgi:hypothetical protein